MLDFLRKQPKAGSLTEQLLAEQQQAELGARESAQATEAARIADVARQQQESWEAAQAQLSAASVQANSIAQDFMQAVANVRRLERELFDALYSTKNGLKQSIKAEFQHEQNKTRHAIAKEIVEYAGSMATPSAERLAALNLTATPIFQTCREPHSTK